VGDDGSVNDRLFDIGVVIRKVNIISWIFLS
jgi:hypothetical protein